MRIAFAGTPEVAIPTLKALLDSAHEVALVISQPAAPRGRNKKIVPSPVAQFASLNNLELITPTSINDAETIEILKSKNIDIAVVVAYGQILKSEALRVFKGGWINAHFSLLPAWRGAAPVQLAIIHGDEVTGVTTFRLEEGMDTGPIFGQVATSIRPEETAGELLERLADLGADLVVKTLDAIADNRAIAVAQSLENVSIAPKLKASDGQIDWSSPALAISRKIRGFAPNPGAWTLLGDLRVELGDVEIEDSQTLKPGEISILKDFVRVGTGSTDIKLLQVKPAGRGWMDSGAWARGLRDSAKEFTSA